MKYTIIITIFIYSSMLFAQTGKWQTLPTDFDNDLHGIYFTDSLTGYICGENGVILKTTDGINWLPQETPTTNTLYDLHFIRDTLGWACGDSGTIIHTTNGGYTWETQSTSCDRQLVSIEFFDYDFGYEGWAVGDSALLFKDSNETIWVGGNTLADGQFNFITFQHPTIYNALFMVDHSLLSTSNGSIWTYIWYFINKPFAITKRLDYSIGSSDKNFWMVGEQGSAYFFEQPFDVWPYYISNTPDTLDLYGVAFDKYALKVWAVGEKGRILLSEDEGLSYSLYETPVNVNLNDICFSGYETGHIVGENGTILYFDEEWILPVHENQNAQILKSYPNPFLNEVKINYQGEVGKRINISIYDIHLRRIRNINYARTLGKTEIIWDGKDKNGNYVKKGIYFFIMKTNVSAQSIKLIKL